MTCSVNHSTITTKFCSVCGAPATTAQAPAQPPQWNQPPAAAPQWNQPPVQPYIPPAQPYAQQPYVQQPAYGAPTYGAPVTPLAGFAFPLASRGKRFGALALDILFYFLTCGFGWIIWTLIVWKDGQTPGKQILKMRTYGTVLARPASWGHMAIRNFLIPSVVSVAYIPSWIAWISSYDSYYGSSYSSSYSGLQLLGNLVSLAFWITTLVLFLNSPINQTIQDRFAKTVILDESYR